MTGSNLSGSNWTFVLTDDQRQRVTEALADKASQIVADASKMSGAAHQAALAHAKRYREIASLFHPTSNTAETLVALPRDTWLMVLGWLLATGPDEYPVPIAEFIYATRLATGTDRVAW